jgi:hypothetical protein
MLLLGAHHSNKGQVDPRAGPRRARGRHTGWRQSGSDFALCLRIAPGRIAERGVFGGPLERVQLTSKEGGQTMDAHVLPLWLLQHSVLARERT